MFLFVFILLVVLNGWLAGSKNDLHDYQPPSSDYDGLYGEYEGIGENITIPENDLDNRQDHGFQRNYSIGVGENVTISKNDTENCQDDSFEGYYVNGVEVNVKISNNATKNCQDHGFQPKNNVGENTTIPNNATDSGHDLGFQRNYSIAVEENITISNNATENRQDHGFQPKNTVGETTKIPNNDTDSRHDHGFQRNYSIGVEENITISNNATKNRQDHGFQSKNTVVTYKLIVKYAESWERTTRNDVKNDNRQDNGPKINHRAVEHDKTTRKPDQCTPDILNKKTKTSSNYQRSMLYTILLWGFKFFCFVVVICSASIFVYLYLTEQCHS